MIATANCEINQCLISKIKPSPENDILYGKIVENNELIDLSNDIGKHGVLEAIVITWDWWLVSGHRRYHAAKMAGLDTVPVIRLTVSRPDMDLHEFLKLLRRYNHQRHKNESQRLKEKLVDVDPDVAHQQLITLREMRDSNAPASMRINGVKDRKAISQAKRPMLDRIIAVIDELQEYWPLTVRAVHYQLLNDPPLRHSAKPKSRYCNDRKSYQDLVDLVTRARLSGEISFDSISDETRPVSNTRFSCDVAEFVDLELYHLFRNYRRDLLQSQLDHIELVLEKMTLQNIVQPIANKYCVPMTVGRGYCSLEPRRQIVERYQASGKDRLVLIVMSDHDPDGMEICESIGRSIRDDFGVVDIVVHKALLTAKQIQQWKLPANGMEAKTSSSNYEKFVEQFGTDVFELEAVSPPRMQQELSAFIESVIDIEKFNEQVNAERNDAATLAALKNEVAESVQELEF